MRRKVLRLIRAAVDRAYKIFKLDAMEDSSGSSLDIEKYEKELT